MAWVVKELKPAARAAADREARRVRRAADREAEDARAYLLVLEDLGAQLRDDVRTRRRDRPPRPPEPDAGEIRVKAPGRATLRDSPLAELFRATT